MSSHTQKILFTASLISAALPLALVALKAKTTTDIALTALCLVVLLAVSWQVSRLLAQSLETEQQGAQTSAVSKALAPLKDKMSATRETLGSHAKNLTRLSSDQQLRATTTTTSAARATENATIIASAIEEMNSSISEIGRQADEATAIAAQAAEKAKVADTTASSLSEKSDQILSIVELIRTIAERTNLLALNATIEAARAGEHGKGFAVVAGEVKSLAKQTADATSRIETQINEVRAASHDMKNQMSAIEQTVDNINKINMTIKTALDEEKAATHEIARSGSETTVATNAVTEGVSHMLVTTEQIRSSAEELSKEIGCVCDSLKSDMA